MPLLRHLTKLSPIRAMLSYVRLGKKYVGYVKLYKVMSRIGKSYVRLYRGYAHYVSVGKVYIVAT